MRAFLALLGSALLAAAAPRPIAFTGLAAERGVDAKTATALSDSVAAALRRVPGISVITPADLATLLSHEQHRQLLGCTSDACMAEVGGALGVDEIVTGSVGRLGQSWLIHLRRLDVRKARAVQEADRRLRGGTVDDVLDVLPAMAAELFGSAAEMPEAAGYPPRAPATKAAPGGADVPANVAPDVRARLRLFTDGHGRYLALDPQGDALDPFYAGDARQLYAQRVYGGGSEGQDFDRVFWDPRVGERWQAELDRKNGRLSLQCGTRTIAFHPAAPARARAVLARAHLFLPRWQREAFAIARDDRGTYFFVDRRRESSVRPEYRLFVGQKGKLSPVALSDAIVDRGGELFITADGRLRIRPAARKADWIAGDTVTPLVYLDIGDEARFAYTELGVYHEPLGTACDGRL